MLTYLPYRGFSSSLFHQRSDHMIYMMCVTKSSNISDWHTSCPQNSNKRLKHIIGGFGGDAGYLSLLCWNRVSAWTFCWLLWVKPQFTLRNLGCLIIWTLGREKWKLPQTEDNLPLSKKCKLHRKFYCWICLWIGCLGYWKTQKLFSLMEWYIQPSIPPAYSSIS